MVSIIKNQLLKHLSRFTKNLSADKINLSTLRGEGELSNLELDEAVLTDLLELPSWLKLTSAWCNKVNIRIQWTKLKSVPIFLHLDEVHIEVVTCEELRSPSSPTNATAFPGATKYSFIHKVIDGITIAVNTVSVIFKSPAFVANVQIAKISVESKSPAWQRCDLRMTRLKDSERGQLLIFKELEWQTVRIEAQSTKDKDLTPLRLLTNQARCRITIKKRLADCLVLGSRLVLILDDLLWVLTDSQLKAALCFIDSLGGLIEKATILERKVKAARKLELLPEYQAQVSQQARSKIQCNTPLSKIFMRYDVVETCYHFLCQRIDLHLCDDPGSGRSSHPDLKDGGALQISLVKFQIDYYPYHLAMADRKHWAKYRENATPHAQWLQQSLNSFRGQFMDLIDIGQSHGASKRNSTDQVEEKQPIEEKRKSVDQQSTQAGAESKKPYTTGNLVKNFVLAQLSTLMTTCIVIRINDFTIYKVTTSTRKPTTKEFIAGDRDKFCLPEDVTIIHAEFTYYYYPGDISFPLPPPKFYVQVNPLQINYDVLSCLWFNSFALNLYQSLLSGASRVEDTDVMYFDVKLEAILPRIILEAQNDYPNQRDRPKSLHLQTSRVSITNVRSSERPSRADLAECLNAFQMGQMFYSSEFPSRDSDFHVISEKFLSHCEGTDNVRSYPSNFTAATVEELTKQLDRKLLWIDAKDMWCCNLEPVWADFFGARAVGSNRPVPFLDAFPVTLWVHMSPKSTSSPKTLAADIHGLAYISNLISVQLNHYQYLFLLRQVESLSEMSTYLVVDSKRILNVNSGSVTIAGLVPQVEVTLIMPSQSPGKENSGGDLESVVPDSSSIADDLLTSMPHHIATTARMEFGSKRLNTSNDVETPQSEVCSMISMEHTTTQQVVTFKQEKIDPPVMQTEAEFPRLKRQPSETTPFIPNNFNVGLSSMKKGFANLMTSIDSALKASPEDGSSDNVSMRSDLSSDSENYLAEKLEEGDSFFGSLNVTGITTVEEATEVVEETPDTQSEKSMDSACKRKDLVSMITFKLSKVEVVQQSCGFDSVIKAQVAKVSSEECSSIPWDEFQAKFSSRSRGWVEVPFDSDCGACIRVRLNHGLKREDGQKLVKKNTGINLNLQSKESLMALFEDELKAQITSVTLALSMSYVTGLTDLIEDEIIADPLSMEIYVENISLQLNEDRPPNNITSPGPVPIDLAISKLQIVRDKKGIFHIESYHNEKRAMTSLANGIARCSISSEADLELNSLRQLVKQLKGDNEELKRRFVALERLSEENSRLRRSHEELEIFKSSLNAAQDHISELVKEKKALEDTAAMLQKQLSKANESANSSRPSWSIKR